LSLSYLVSPDLLQHQLPSVVVVQKLFGTVIEQHLPSSSGGGGGSSSSSSSTLCYSTARLGHWTSRA